MLFNTIKSGGAAPVGDTHRDSQFPYAPKIGRGAGRSVVLGLLTYLFNERANSGTKCSGAFDGERDEFDFSGLEVFLHRGGASEPLKLLATFALVSAAGLYAGDVFTLASNRRLGVFSEVGLGVSRDDIDCAPREAFVARPAVDVHGFFSKLFLPARTPRR